MKKSIGMAIAVAILVGAAIQSHASVSAQTASVQAERVTVTVPISYRQDRRVVLGNEPVAADVLQLRVRQLMETRAQKTVFLSADRDITWGEVIDVMDLLKAAGAEQVALTSN
jgi:biopolymer transport protein ExbD